MIGGGESNAATEGYGSSCDAASMMFAITIPTVLLFIIRYAVVGGGLQNMASGLYVSDVKEYIFITLFGWY